MMQFSVQKIAEIMVQGMMKFIILVNHDFFPAYMGVFWSEATPVFSALLSRVTRVLKTVSGRNFAHFQHFSSWRKNAEIHLFPSDWKFGACFCRDRPGPDALDRCVSVCDGQFRTLDFRGTGEKHYIIIHGKGAKMTVTDLHHPTMYSFLGGLSLESPPKNSNLN